MPAFQGQASEWPRKEFLYWTDDGNVAGLRYDQWKLVFMEQRAHELRSVGGAARARCALPKLFDLRADPFERADHEGIGYSDWRLDRAFLLAPAQVYVGNWLQSFKDFPPRQKPGQLQPRATRWRSSRRRRARTETGASDQVRTDGGRATSRCPAPHRAGAAPGR